MPTHKLSAYQFGQLVGRSARIKMQRSDSEQRRKQMLTARGTFNGSDPWRQGRKIKGKKPDEPTPPVE